MQISCNSAMHTKKKRKKTVKKEKKNWCLDIKKNLEYTKAHRHYVYRLDRQMDIYIKATYVSTVNI